MGRPVRHGHAKGHSGTPTYLSWRHMIARCTATSDIGYANYGGRGIGICKRWLTFENFLADMGERPEGMTLDRFPDNNGNYELGNARWATISEQQRNRSDNNMITFEGKTLCLTEWAERSGLLRQTLTSRLRRGESFPHALRQVDR